MAETVDTRVVEARFDSKQFEQGVDKTVKKLDELKKSLNLKDGEKTIAQIGDKISEASDKASNSLETLEKRFTTFFGMLKNKLVGAVADEIVGGIMKIKSSIEGLVTSLSTGQIGYGMQRYTDMLTSVRTLVSSGVNQDAAYTTIERLGEYADQTSYSLDQLVSTMSKFKTAGASLDTAQRMVEGLSNAAASMGVNAQEASRAYLNLQQAYSKGKMTQADWISFESLPMVGEKFNQAIIDAAVAVGTLKENGKGAYDVVSKAVKEAGGSGGRVSGAAAKGITSENMGSKLASGWFNKQVMEEVFGGTYYFAEVGIDEVNEIKAKERKIKEDIKADIEKGLVAEENFDKEVTDRLQKYFDETNKDKLETKKKEIAQRKEAAKLDLEAKKNDQKAYTEAKKEYEKQIKELDKEFDEFEKNNHLSAFAYQAFRAGQEARSFTDVMNTLKDTISRGWATSFELIFGKLDEAADFFTKLTESQFAEGIYKIGEFRNLVLQNWRDVGGRESMLGVLQQIDDLFGSIYKKMGLIEDEADKTVLFNDMFDQQMYNNILRTEGKDQAEAYKSSIQQYVDMSPFERAAKELGQRLMILTRNIGDFFERVKKWFTEADSTGTSRLQRISNIIEGFGTIFTGVLHGAGIALEEFGNTYNAIKPVFDTLWKNIEFVLQPIFDLFNPNKKNKNGIDLYNTLTVTLRNLNKVVGHLVDPLSTILDLIGRIFNNVIWNNIEKALKPIFDMLNPNTNQNGVNAYQSLADALDNLNTVVQGIAGPLETVFNVIGDVLGEVLPFIVEMGASTVIGNIQFFADAFALLLEVLGIGSAQQKRNEGVLQGIEQGIRDLGDACKSAFQAVSDFFASLWDDLRKLLGIGDDINKTGDGNLFSNIQNFFATNEFVQTVKGWIDKAIADVGNFIKDIPNRISNLGITVGDFFKGIFYEKKTTGIYYGANGRTTTEEWIKKPLTEWLEQAGKDVWKFITKDIPDFIMSIPSIVTEFIHGLLYKNEKVGVDVDENGKRTSVYKEVETPLKLWLDQAVLDVTNFITKDIPEFVKSIPSVIGKFFEHLFGEGGVVQSNVLDKNGKIVKVTAVKKERGILRDWLDQAILTVKTFIKDLPKNIAKLPSIIGEFFKGLFYDKKTTSTGQIEWTPKPFTEWVDKNIIQNLKAFVDNLPDYIGQGIGTVANFAGRVLSAIFGKEDGAEVVADDVTEGIRKPFLGMNVTGVVNSIKGVGKRILNGVMQAFTGETDWESNKNWLAEGVANLIKNIETEADKAWNSVKEWILGLPTKIHDYFVNDNTGAAEGENSTIGSAILGFAGKVGEWISDIPNILLSAWDSASELIGGLWKKIVGFVTGDDLILEEDSAEGLKQSKRILDLINEGLTQDEAMTQVWREDNPITANISDFFVNLGDHLKEFAENFPTTIEDGWNTFRDWILDIPSAVAGWLKKDAEDANATGEGSIASEISKFVTNMGVWISKIPADLLEIWKGAEQLSGTLWDTVIGWITGSGAGTELKGKFRDKFNFLTSIANQTPEAVENIKNDLLKQQWREDNPIAANIEDFFGDLVKYFTDKLTNLPETLSNAWTTAKEIGAKIGPKILEGLQSAIGWVSEKITSVTNTINKAHGEGKSVFDVVKEKIIGSEKDAKDGKAEAETENSLWGIIQNIGEALKGFIVDTIPKFITSAFEEIKILIPRLINRIFGGKETSEDVVKNVSGPIKEGWADSLKKSTKDAKTVEQILNKSVPRKQALVKAKKNAQDVVAEYVEDNPLIDFAEYAKNELGIDYDENEAGGFDILSLLGISTGQAAGASGDATKAKGFFGSLGDIWSGITGFLDQIKSNDGLKIVGIAAVIALIIHELRIIVDNLSFIDDIGWTAKWVGIGMLIAGLTTLIGYIVVLASKEEEFEDVVDSQGNVTGQRKTKFGRVKQVLSDLMKDIKEILNLVTWIMGISMVKEIASTIKEANKSTTKIEMETDKAKKGGLKNKLKNGAKGLSDMFFSENGLFGTFFTSLSSGLGGSIGKTAGIVTTGGSIGSLIEILAGNLETSLTELGQGLESIAQDLGGADGIVSTLAGLTGDLPDAITNISQVRELIGKMFELLYFDDSEIREKYAAYINENGQQHGTVLQTVTMISDMFSRLSGGLSLFKNAISGYGQDSTQVVTAMSDIIGMKDRMIDFANFSATDYFKTFIDAIATMGSVMKLYSSSLSEDFKEEPKDIDISNLVKFLGQLFGNEEFKSLITQFGSTTLPSMNVDSLRTAEQIIVFTQALMSIAEACKSLNGDEGTSIQTFIDMINGIKITNDNGVTNFSRNFGEIGNALGSFAVNTAALTEANLNNADRALTMLLRIATGLRNIPDDSFFSKFFFGDKGLDAFGANIKSLGGYLKDFFGSLENLNNEGRSVSFNADNIVLAMNVINTLARSAVSIGWAGGTAFSSEFVNSIPGFASKIIEFITKINDSEDIQNLTEDNINSIYEAIKITDQLFTAVQKIHGIDKKDVEAGSPLQTMADWLGDLVGGLTTFTGRLVRNEGLISHMKTHGDDILDFINVIDRIASAIGKSNLHLVSANEIETKFSSLANALFGYEDEVAWPALGSKVYEHRYGIFERLESFMTMATNYEGIASEVPNAITVFNGFTSMMTSFCEMISDMSYADQVSYLATGITTNYEGYVDNITQVMAKIIEKKDDIDRFFTYAGSFNSTNLNNGLTMFSALNQLGQTLNNFANDDVHHGLMNLEAFSWAEFFETLEQNISSDLFSPTFSITPVLDVNDAFKEKAAEMHKILGVTLDDEGRLMMNVTMGMTEGIQFPETHDYSEALEGIKDKLDNIDTSTSDFKSALRSVQFNIDGIRLVDKIGPIMDTWLGTNGSIIVRGTITQGDG